MKNKVNNSEDKPRIVSVVGKNMNRKRYLFLGFLAIIILVVVFCLFFWKRTQKLPQQEVPQPTPQETKPSQKVDLGNGFSAQTIESSYKIASGKTSGNFKTGQAADIMLSGVDFNNSGGPLLFNHPGNIATDGKRLLLADRNNNRVLIWTNLPTGNTPPDLVLGQKDFVANNPGLELDQLNWPIGVATDGTHILVADTYNDRILIWKNFPTENGQKADLVLQGERGTGPRDEETGEIVWPWGIWTNGEKLVVTSTGAARVLIWNNFPTQNNQPPDLVLALRGKFGTPRSVGSDGKHLIIGDHNALGGNAGNFFWKTFPTKNNQEYDFFMPEIMQVIPPHQPPPPIGESFDPNNLSPPNPSQPQNPSPIQSPTGEPPRIHFGDVFWGITFTPEGKLLLLGGSRLAIWNSFPENENEPPDLVVGSSGGPFDQTATYTFFAGDGSGMALAKEKLYISLSNGNKIVGFNKILETKDAKPDFAIGSPDVETNTLETNFIISNPVPVSNGKSLFVSSDFDRKLYVWKNLPDESGAKPDLVYSLPDGPWDNALYGETLALSGKRALYIWIKLPTEPRVPDFVFNEKVGSVVFNELQGVTLDQKYFYLSDSQANKIYIWEGLPSENSAPKLTLDSQSPGRLSSDGTYLVVTSTLAPQRDFVRVYKVSELSKNAKPQVIGNPGAYNLPQYAVVSHGKLFVADTGFNRLLIWNKIEDALSGKEADTIFGVTQNIQRAEEAKPQIGRDKLFWPATPTFDGTYLWLGEFKFSERILRFSPKTTNQSDL